MPADVNEDLAFVERDMKGFLNNLSNLSKHFQKVAEDVKKNNLGQVKVFTKDNNQLIAAAQKKHGSLEDYLKDNFDNLIGIIARNITVFNKSSVNSFLTKQYALVKSLIPNSSSVKKASGYNNKDEMDKTIRSLASSMARNLTNEKINKVIVGECKGNTNTSAIVKLKIEGDAVGTVVDNVNFDYNDLDCPDVNITGLERCTCENIISFASGVCEYSKNLDKLLKDAVTMYFNSKEACDLARSNGEHLTDVVDVMCYDFVEIYADHFRTVENLLNVADFLMSHVENYIK